MFKNNDKALIVENLTKKYFNKSKDQTINALDNVTFSIEKGAIIALLGPNGAGKINSYKYTCRHNQ